MSMVTTIIALVLMVDTVRPPAEDVREQFALDDFYEKCVIVETMPVVASERVSDEAPGRRDLDGDRVSARVIKAAGASLHAGGDAVPDLSTLNGIY